MAKKSLILGAACVLFAAVPTAWPLANGLSGFSLAAGAGGPSDGYVSGGYSFVLGPYLCVGPELGAGFGGGSSFLVGGGGRLYLNRALTSVAQPHLLFGGGLAVADYEADDEAAANGADTGAYLRLGAGLDADIPRTPVSPFLDAGAFAFSAGDPKIGFIIGAGLRVNVARALWLERRDRERAAEDSFIAENLSRAREANERGDHADAVAICGELLESYPERDDVRELLLESERLLAESMPEPEPEPEPEPTPKPRPKPKPEPEPEPERATIPPEAVTAYERGKAAVAGGALAEGIYIFSAVVGEYPSYGAARDALVDAYLLQGLDHYSRGRISDALRSWRRALIYDPGNAKARRYIDKVEREKQ
jgi:tetratricopeptide (TPR) repeat protein